MVHSGGGGGCAAFIRFGRPPLKPRSDRCHLFRLPHVSKYY